MKHPEDVQLTETVVYVLGDKDFIGKYEKIGQPLPAIVVKVPTAGKPNLQVLHDDPYVTFTYHPVVPFSAESHFGHWHYPKD